MLNSIWEDTKRQFSYGNMVTQLVIINCAVFIFVNIVRIAIFMGGFGHADAMAPFWDFVFFFSISDEWLKLFINPWRVFTSMFLHEGLWHLISNMLFLYWFGRIAADFIGNQKILPIYILGGIVGAFFFLFSASYMGYVGSYAYGASAAVMAIVVAAASIAPNYQMNLILVGPVKLKYLAAIVVFMDLIAIASFSSNTGGHFAHLGGAIFGGLFVQQLKAGNDLSIPANRVFDAISNFFRMLFQPNHKAPQKRKRKVRVAYKNPNKKPTSNRKAYRNRQQSSNRKSRQNPPDYNGMNHQEKLDAILDKIKLTGYDSLTKEEKEFLFNASKKV